MKHLKIPLKIKYGWRDFGILVVEMLEPLPVQDKAKEQRAEGSVSNPKSDWRKVLLDTGKI